MLCHNASFPPDSPVSILTAKEVFVNLIARVVKLNVQFIRHLLLHLMHPVLHAKVLFIGLIMWYIDYSKW